MALGILGRLFNPKMIAETARSAVRGLDDIVYTDQEKAEKTETAQALYAKLWMAATPSAVSRRLIAVLLVATWCLLILFGVAIYAFGQVDTAEFTFRVLKEVLLQPVNIIVGFYFLKQIVTDYQGAKK